MTHLLLAILKFIRNIVHKFITYIEAKFKNVKTEVKSDVAGLQKFVTLKSLTIDADGNYSLDLALKYQDAAGNELNYADPTKQSLTISGTAPDKSISSANYTPEQQAQATTANAIIAALSPAIKAIIPDAI